MSNYITETLLLYGEIASESGEGKVNCRDFVSNLITVQDNDDEGRMRSKTWCAAASAGV